MKKESETKRKGLEADLLKQKEERLAREKAEAEKVNKDLNDAVKKKNAAENDAKKAIEEKSKAE